MTACMEREKLASFCHGTQHSADPMWGRASARPDNYDYEASYFATISRSFSKDVRTETTICGLCDVSGLKPGPSVPDMCWIYQVETNLTEEVATTVAEPQGES